MSSGRQEFDIVLTDYGDGGCGFAAPFDVSDIYGTPKQVRVTGTIDGIPYRGSLTPHADRHYMGVNRTMRETIGKNGGDLIHVVMEPEAEPQTVDIPEDLLWALDANRDAQTIFDQFSYARRKEYVTWIESSRYAEIRARRVEQAIEMICEGVTRQAS